MTSAAETPNSGGTDWPYGGARWWKFDFHTHTPASQDYGKGPDQAAERNVEPRDWLLGFMAAGIDCVAVTDHNSGEWIDRLKAALADLTAEPCSGFRPLWLFPGVEITANGGIHILAIMDPSKGSADVASLLGSVEFHGTRGASDTTANRSVIQVIEAIDKVGAIAIPAHVDAERGLWGLTGNTLGTLLRSDKIFAVESSGTVEAPAKFKRPTRYDELGVRWADVLGSDCHHPRFASPTSPIGDHFTWVKMAEPSLEGLRLALLDGNDYSIRRSHPSESFDPPALPQHHLQELLISDARFMGRGEAAKVAFSPWLNAIVGGRGTGKSTIIHALRIVSHRSRELQKFDDRSSAKRTFERFDRVPKHRSDEGGLDERTAFSMIAVRDGVRHRVRWSQSPGTAPGETDPLPTVEEMPSGTWEASEVQEVTPERFPLRIFSQGQLAELADGDRQALLQIVDEAAGTAVHRTLLEEATAAFLQTRGRIRDLDRQLKRRADIQVSVTDTERKLRRFEDSGHAEILNTYRHRSRQRQEVDRHFEVADRAVELIESTADQLHSEDLDRRAFTEDSPENLIAVSAIDSLAEATAKAAEELKQTAANLRVEIESERSGLGTSQWQMALDEAVAAHGELVEALGAEGISSPGEYGRLVQERSRLEGELAALESQAEERSRLIERSEQELEGVFEARCTASEARRAFLCQVLAGNEFVRMELRDFGDSDSLEAAERSLRDALGDEDHFENDILHVDGDERSGIVVDLLGALPPEQAERQQMFKLRIDSLRRRFTEACMDRGDFGGHFNNFLQRQYERAPEFLDRLRLTTAAGERVAVVKVEVPRSLFIHRSPGGYFHRLADSKRQMSTDFLARMLQQRSQTRLIRFDEQPVAGANVESLSRDLCASFRTARSDADADTFLQKLGVVAPDEEGLLRPTVAGVLVACAEPRRWLPNAYIQAVAYRGGSIRAASGEDPYQLDASDICGPAMAQIADACGFVLKNMKTSAVKSIGRQDKPQYDMAAIFEAVTNAVAHRDYSIHGSKIRLRLFDDRLELYSPGAVVNSMSLDSLRYRQAARNETLCSLLAKCALPRADWLETGRGHIMEKRGEGVPIILDNSTALSGREPHYRIIDDSELLLTIYAADTD